MCGRVKPIKRFVPSDINQFGGKSYKEKLAEVCKRCGLTYHDHHVEPDKNTLVRSCSDDAPFMEGEKTC